MTVKEYLKQACCINQSIEVKKALLNNIEENIPLATNNKLLKKLQQEKEKIKASLDMDIQIKMNVLSLVEHIEDFTLKTILQYKYICGMTQDEIALKLNYSPRHIVRMHTKAVKEAEKFYKIA